MRYVPYQPRSDYWMQYHEGRMSTFICQIIAIGALLLLASFYIFIVWDILRCSKLDILEDTYEKIRLPEKLRLDSE